MASLLIKNGRVIDPANGVDRVTNVLIENGRVTSYDLNSRGEDKVIDATGKLVVPGLIDPHVHLREPGFEEDETIATGTAAAVAGGFTSIACMPNTNPPIDSRASVEFILHQAQRADNCNVYPVACISQGRAGESLAEMGQLSEAGAVAFSDDGAPVSNAELMRRAFEYSIMFDKAIMNHPEDKSLTHGCVMHEGLVSVELGLAGIPAAAEEIMIARDITLAELTGGRLHEQHVSSKGSVDLIRRAKARGVRVTAEVTPHHISLTDECLRTFDSCYKMNPPLRSQEDVDACIEGLKDGTLDIIGTDHAPHAPEKKMVELDRAPFGIVGLETALGVLCTKLIVPGHLTWPQLIEKMTINPARLLNLKKGSLEVGADADITIIDPNMQWTVDASQFKTKSRNTPYNGWTLTGRAVYTIVGGRIRYSI